MSTRQIGKLGEQVASRYLSTKGYTILETNYFTRYGEIDLVARDKAGTIVFAEVKTRTSVSFGDPALAADKEKLRKFTHAAQWWASRHPHPGAQYRIDVIAVVLNRETRTAQVRQYENVIV